MFALALVASIGNGLSVFAATPRAALLKAFAPEARRVHSAGAVGFVRVNIVGRYALILSHGLVVEGEALRDPVLLERFSFGWQPIEIANFACRFDAHVLSPRDRRELMIGMPQPDGKNVCGNDDDWGPIADVEAVRIQMQGPLVPSVRVAGAYARGGWYGAGGGEVLFKRVDGKWQRVTGGGGALGVDEMRRYGVPKRTWCALGVYDAPCPP
jgi:hypothetical protein